MVERMDVPAAGVVVSGTVSAEPPSSLPDRSFVTLGSRSAGRARPVLPSTSEQGDRAPRWDTQRSHEDVELISTAPAEDDPRQLRPVRVPAVRS